MRLKKVVRHIIDNNHAKQRARNHQEASKLDEQSSLGAVDKNRSQSRKSFQNRQATKVIWIAHAERVMIEMVVEAWNDAKRN